MKMEKHRQDTLRGNSISNSIYSMQLKNFVFNVFIIENSFSFRREDMYAQDSIDLLQNSGLQFRKHEEDGIEPQEFAELLMTSGIIASQMLLLSVLRFMVHQEPISSIEIFFCRHRSHGQHKVAQFSFRL
jgi:hypothetical protein